ncbi:metallopeptidase TldD-related protein [Venenivibrio stagnispumantis]|uniref:PmbA protein n=1 Tax=Venenivibrio stagnispumantis TaxID=407998 RepID=A0AA45WNH2_9AQUI|nr:TldD/PmbA family protein [Venenivibrio stagnispumantis]MCW4573238.1 TldD/PmbA family protein [Venenivibrio stagnispumantis]SMP18444.1 PmbA protein [Venenivibrio stagnispumantis]
MIEKIIDIAKTQLKGYDWEIYYQKVSKLKAESNDFQLESITTSDDIEFSIRVLNNKAQGFAYSSSFTEEAIKDTINKAKELSKITSPDDGNIIIDKLQETEKIEYFDTFTASLPPLDKAINAIELERITKSLDDRIKKVRSSTFIENIYETYLINSNNVEIKEKGTIYTAMVSAVAEENGDSQIVWQYKATRFLQDLDLNKLAKDAVYHAVSLLNAKPLTTRKIAVYFPPFAFAELLDTFSSAFTADALIKGKTLFANKENTIVASDVVNIIDNGRLPKGLATSSYDAEGIPKGKTVLIQNGIFKGFLHNLYTAKKLNTKSTGNAVRNGVKSLPSVGITNFYLEPTDTDIKEMMKNYDEILYVIDMMGLHTADPISGEFSLGISGILFSKGEKVQAVSGMTIADNFINLLNKISYVGNDLEFYGNVGSPSVIVEEMVVAGE